MKKLITFVLFLPTLLFSQEYLQDSTVSFYVKRTTENNKSSSIEFLNNFENVDTANVFYNVDTQPVFRGGNQELVSFFVKNLKVTQEEIDKGVPSRLVLRFIVNEKGEVESPIFLIHGNALIEDQILLSLTKLPLFTPGQLQGENVKVYVILPIFIEL